MIDRAQSPKIECYDLPEDKPATKPNPFKIGEQVRLRDGTITNGTVLRILGSEVLIAWDDIPGDPQWHHQDYISAEKKPTDRGPAPPPPAPAADYRPEARPNPFKIGEAVRLRDGTAANGIVAAIFGNEVRIAWDGVPGDPQWYHQDFVLAEKRRVERVRAAPENQEADIVDQACRLVAGMDDNQRQRFLAHIRATYK